MGFLDEKSRVLDVVLTELGRTAYSEGKMELFYFSLFDDGIDYDPFIDDASTDVDSVIDSTPILEATFVRNVRTSRNVGGPKSQLFGAGSGYESIPSMSIDLSSIELRGEQSRDEEGSYAREGSNVVSITPLMEGEIEQGNPGFIVRLFSSGSFGETELIPRRSMNGKICFDPFIEVIIDQEATGTMGRNR